MPSAKLSVPILGTDSFFLCSLMLEDMCLVISYAVKKKGLINLSLFNQFYCKYQNLQYFWLNFSSYATVTS